MWIGCPSMMNTSIHNMSGLWAPGPVTLGFTTGQGGHAGYQGGSVVAGKELK